MEKRESGQIIRDTREKKGLEGGIKAILPVFAFTADKYVFATLEHLDYLVLADRHDQFWPAQVELGLDESRQKLARLDAQAPIQGRQQI